MSEREVIQGTQTLVTQETLIREFRSLGLRDGSVVLVHASLSSLGWVAGGALAVVHALLRTVGDRGTLVMPTHSGGLSDPANWQNPPVPQSWWEPIRQTSPAYDPQTTPTRGMGALPETFRTFPGVRRSGHPLHSFAALGAHAEVLTARHQLDDSLGDDSPLARLYDLNGSTLLLGVGYDSCTTLHLAERRALGDGQPRTRTGAPVMIDGQRIWQEFLDPDVRSEDFHLTGDAYERAHGTVSAQSVGNAPAKLIPVRELVNFGVDWFRNNRNIQV